MLPACVPRIITLFLKHLRYVFLLFIFVILSSLFSLKAAEYSRTGFADWIGFVAAYPKTPDPSTDAPK